MKALKIIGIILATIIAIVLIVALFVPKVFSYEKSISINAPIDSVWEKTNTLAGLDSWSPWNRHDHDMKKQLAVWMELLELNSRGLVHQLAKAARL